MQHPLQLQTFYVGQHSVSLYVPHIKAIQQQYTEQKQTDAKAPFPYWAQVWPAALGMGTFLLENVHLIKDKNVLELAAGLGLPSLVAAHFAQTVTCTDYLQEAVAVAQQSALYNKRHNMQCSVLNWNTLPKDLSTDVLLLSDVNYEPHQFEILYKVLHRFLKKGTTIILSTPQRLMAKPFIERLLPWCVQQQQTDVAFQQQKVAITLLVLKGK